MSEAAPDALAPRVSHFALDAADLAHAHDRISEPHLLAVGHFMWED